MPKRSPRPRNAAFRKKTFKERNNGLNPEQVAIINAPNHLLIKEYNLIQKHKSNLSSLLRETLEIRVKQLVEQGKIKASELDES